MQMKLTQNFNSAMPVCSELQGPVPVFRFNLLWNAQVCFFVGLHHVFLSFSTLGDKVKWDHFRGTSRRDSVSKGHTGLVQPLSPSFLLQPVSHWCTYPARDCSHGGRTRPELTYSPSLSVFFSAIHTTRSSWKEEIPEPWASLTLAI